MTSLSESCIDFSSYSLDERLQLSRKFTPIFVSTL